MDQNLAQFRQMQQLDFVAGNYSEFGGLRLAPIGLFALLMASFVGGVVVLPVGWASLLGGLGLHLTVLGYWLTAYWYRREYGMTHQAWPRSMAELARWLPVWAAMFLMVLGAIDGSGAFMGVVGKVAGGLAIGWIFFYWACKRRIWPQGYALMSLFVIGVMLYQAPFPEQSGLHGLVLAFVGMSLLFASAFDHGRLDRRMKKLEDEDE